MSRDFGIYPEGMELKQWWGARAILKAGMVDLLPDRQGYEGGDDADRDDFVNWINSTALSFLRQKAKECFFSVWEDIATIDSEDGKYHCEATPKNSGGGYLYIGAWEKIADK